MWVAIVILQSTYCQHIEILPKLIYSAVMSWFSLQTSWLFASAWFHVWGALGVSDARKTFLHVRKITHLSKHTYVICVIKRVFQPVAENCVFVTERVNDSGSKQHVDSTGGQSPFGGRAEGKKRKKKKIPLLSHRSDK